MNRDVTGWPGEPGRSGADVLAAYDEPRDAPRARWLLVGGAAVAVLALVAGVTYGVGALSGGGSQPEDALPSGAFGYAKVDLDPPAGQKIDGFRFMRKFPALRERLGDEDLREIVFEAVADGAGWSEVDFDSEVAPWMGKRIGVAAYAPAETDDQFPDPTVVVALQVTDADEAREGLGRLADLEAGSSTAASGSTSRLGFVVADGYALLAETQAVADGAARDAEDGNLASDQQLAADLSAAGDGVMAAWLDMGRAVDAMGANALGMGGVGGMTGAFGSTGRSTYVARFDGPDVFEVSGRVTGADAAGWATHPVEGMDELPESSVVAFALADGEELVPRLYESLREALRDQPGQGMPDVDEMVADAERELGIEIPEDLAALLGDNLVAALDGTSSGSVQFGARVRTDVTRAERVLDALESGAGGEWVLARERVGDDLVVASTAKQAGRLAAVGTLGDGPGFSDAMPDLSEADLALWVDPKGVLEALFGGMGGGTGDGEVSTDENLEPIEGIGLTASSRDEGSGTFRLRLVAR